MLALSIACTLAAVAWAYLVAGHGGYWRTSEWLPRVTREPDAWPDVVAVVPARNEAEMLPATLPALLGQEYPGTLTVIVVDDGSSDGTGEVAARIARESARPLRVIPGTPPPAPGAGGGRWAGKVWAMAQGLRAAGPGGYVLFTDADIAWEAHTLRRLVAAAEGDDRDLVSQMALLRAATGWERVIVPAFVYFFAQLYPFRRVNAPGSRTAAAAGGCMLVRRGALETVRRPGADQRRPHRRRGHRPHDQAPAGPLLARADPAGGQRAPVPPARQPVADGGQVGVHPAELLPGAAGRDAHRPAVPVRPAAGRRGHRTRRPARRRRPGASGPTAPAALTAGAGLAGWALMSLSYLPMLRLYRLSPLRAPGLPLIALLYAGMTADSARRHYAGRGAEWRGRTNQTRLP